MDTNEYTIISAESILALAEILRHYSKKDGWKPIGDIQIVNPIRQTEFVGEIRREMRANLFCLVLKRMVESSIQPEKFIDTKEVGVGRPYETRILYGLPEKKED